MKSNNLSKDALLQVFKTIRDDVVQMAYKCVENGEYFHLCLGGTHRMPQYDSECPVYCTCTSTEPRRYYNASTNTFECVKERNYYCFKDGKVMTGKLFVFVPNLLLFVLMFLLIFFCILVNEAIQWMRRQNCCIGPKQGSNKPTNEEAMNAVRSIVCLGVFVDDAAGKNGQRNQAACALEAAGKMHIFLKNFVTPHPTLFFLLFSFSSLQLPGLLNYQDQY
jgi:hypothetical protein